ncbi:hypothetical protein RB653_006880 [Dictyostelium firmibasis]|uniref:SnoaL-like domain-containing protein n=1 Tax=Dictyostelium firmibasis TaxID=79012 RepID=A0AAN7YNI2_9MYCE
MEKENLEIEELELKVELDESIKTCRNKSEELVNNLKHCLEKRDFEKFNDFFDPKAVLNRCNEEIIGRNLIRSYINDLYIGEELELIKVRTLIDSNQRHIACEWITRRRELNSDNEYDQGMASWYLKLSPNDYTVKTWYIWIDSVFETKVPNLDAPIPKESNWSPCPIQYYNRKEMSEFLRKRSQCFEEEDLESWSSYIHDDVIVRPPWNLMVNKNSCIEGAKEFFNNFEDPSVSKLELLYDETIPNWCVYIQIFSSTNRATGKKGEDVDFIFNEIVDGKVRYWRSYFSANYNKIYTENNFNFFIETLSKYSKNNFENEKNSLNSSTNNNKNNNSNIIGSGKD